MDTGVLIAAVRGDPVTRLRAQAVLSQVAFEFQYSPLLQLEVTLQAKFNKRNAELEFYKEYFRSAVCYGDLNRMFEIGSVEAEKHRISVLDALHIAAANLSRCKFLFTTEATTKPMFRTKLVKVASILSTKKRPY